MTEIPAAAIEAAATELATLANLPRMAAQALIDAGAVNIGGRLMAQIDEQDARVEEGAVAVLHAALPHLLPGLATTLTVLAAEKRAGMTDLPHDLDWGYLLGYAHGLERAGALAGLLPDRADDIGTEGGGTWPDPQITDMAQRYGRLVVPPGDDWEVRPDGDPGDRPRRSRSDRTDDTPDD